MWDILTYLLLIVAVSAAVIAAALVVRGYMSGTSPLEGFFGPKPERRLDVIEHHSVDGRRKLVLIRRDDVEHLIMTGGPVDVVIETGIGPPRSRPEPVEPSASVFQRSPRAFGQAGAVEK